MTGNKTSDDRTYCSGCNRVPAECSCEDTGRLWRAFLDARAALQKSFNAGGGDMFVSIKILQTGLICGDHLAYRGKKPPTNDCKRCREVHEDRMRRNVK